LDDEDEEENMSAIVLANTTSNNNNQKLSNFTKQDEEINKDEATNMKNDSEVDVNNIKNNLNSMQHGHNEPFYNSSTLSDASTETNKIKEINYSTQSKII
jgi:hypothetical protein